MYIWINDMKIHNQAPETLGSTSTRAWCFETDRLRAGGVHVVVHENFPRVFEDRKSAFLDFACTWGVEILLEHHEIPETYVEVISRIKDGVLVVHPVCFQQKIFGNNKDLHLHLVIFFLNRRISGWIFRLRVLTSVRPWMLLRRIAWDSGIVCQRTELLWNSWVERLLTTTSMLMMDTCYEYEGFKWYPHICLIFSRLSFPFRILTSVPFHQLPKRGRRRSAFYCPLAKTTRVPLVLPLWQQKNGSCTPNMGNKDWFSMKFLSLEVGSSILRYDPMASVNVRIDQTRGASYCHQNIPKSKNTTPRQWPSCVLGSVGVCLCPVRPTNFFWLSGCLLVGWVFCARRQQNLGNWNRQDWEFNRFLSDS